MSSIFSENFSEEINNVIAEENHMRVTEFIEIHMGGKVIRNYGSPNIYDEWVKYESGSWAQILFTPPFCIDVNMVSYVWNQNYDIPMLIRNWGEPQLPSYIKFIFNPPKETQEVVTKEGPLHIWSPILSKPVLYLLDCHPELNVHGFECIHVSTNIYPSGF